MDLPYRALLLDISGVLYDGSTRIDGAADAVEEARRQGLTLRFVTNTSTKSSAMLIDDLRNMGIDIDADELFTAPIAAMQYVKQHSLRPYCLLHQALKNDFAAIDQSDPNCVILGDARDGLNYDSMNRAFRLCIDGAPLLGIGMNKYFKDNGGLKLDAGAFIRAIEWATDTTALIMGKPSKDFFDQVVASTGFSAEQCLMVGDDVISDVCGAVDAGLQGCLVKTGKYRSGDETQLSANAIMIDSVAQLFN